MANRAPKLAPDPAPDPESQFPEPAAVSRAPNLTRRQKVNVLNDWHQLVQQRLDSANEGMLPAPASSPGNQTGSQSTEAELLRQIDIELEKFTSGKQ